MLFTQMKKSTKQQIGAIYQTVPRDKEIQIHKIKLDQRQCLVSGILFAEL